MLDFFLCQTYNTPAVHLVYGFVLVFLCQFIPAELVSCRKGKVEIMHFWRSLEFDLKFCLFRDYDRNIVVFLLLFCTQSLHSLPIISLVPYHFQIRRKWLFVIRGA